MPDADLMPPVPDLAAPKKRPAPQLRAFDDAAATRGRVYDSVLKAAQNLEPLTTFDGKHTLRLVEPHYVDPDHFSLKDQKQALLTGGTLGRRLQGTWELVGPEGQVLDRRRQIVARVPHWTQRGTVVQAGTDYGVANQARLLPATFVRRTAAGTVEAHANIIPGTGPSHRYLLDPAQGVFKIKLAQAEMPLLPLLKVLGAGDQELRDAWGDELWQQNQRHNDGGTLKKLKARLLRKNDLLLPDETQTARLVDAFARMKVDPEVMRRTLGKPYDHLDKDAVLDATKKLLAVSRGSAEPDDRDHMAYQTLYGPEDLFAERLRRDHGHLRRAALKKAALEGSLAKMPSGLLTRQLEQVLFGSGLASAPEEINPSELLDKQSRVTRMGEGGIPSYDAVPQESRSVQPSYYGYIDPLRTPESFSAGVDNYITSAARKGDDGRLYAQFTNLRTGKPEWKSPQELADATLTFPGVLDSPDWRGAGRVPVIKNGAHGYARRGDVDYVLPHFEHAFSHLGNLVPMKSTIKPQRVAMASRMLSQALPLVDAEAPLVRSALPGDPGRSYDEEYGRHMGAVHAARGGQVVAADADALRLRYDDGREDTVELYNQWPYQRKTVLHQTPLVQAGDRFAPGQLLARSNYTDAAGTTALGRNLRTAFMAWHGLNYEDAIVLSASAAQKLTSEHAYVHDLEADDKTKFGTDHYLSVFPSKFAKNVLAKLDDRGMARPGQVVQYGEPLILAARAKDQVYNKVHRKQDPGFADASVLWQHHDPGVVLDAVWGKQGPAVVVKSLAAMQIADKLANRYGNKGVVNIIADDQMPHDANGRPFEVVSNDLGTISRCYDEDTEFYTRGGWKKGVDVTEGESLLGFDPDAFRVRWVRQTAPMHCADHDGPMVRISNAEVDLLVTPHHKLFAAPVPAAWSPAVCAFAGHDWRAGQARDFLGDHVLLPVPAALPHKRGRTAAALEALVRPADWALAPYRGLVFCPSVATGYVVVRRHGKVCCAGNTNPGQNIEAALGKLAEATGRPVNVPDFGSEDDLAAWADRQLKAHGLSSTETVHVPGYNRKVPGIQTGNVYWMKLHHQSESKLQGRGTGSYSADEEPAKGGPTGCFVAGTLVDTEFSAFDIVDLVVGRETFRVRSRDAGGAEVWRPLSDWFHYRVPRSELVRVELAGGGRLVGTAGHEVILKGGVRKSLGDLVCGDELEG